MARRPIIVLGVMLACGPCAFALDPALDMSQYAHTAWKVRDGFTKGIISSIAQTPDGYLWLGTEFGLLRFDGVRAVPWKPPAGEDLPSSYIRSLFVARDGTLWIGTIKGLASWKDGKLTQHPDFAGKVIDQLVEDRDGTIWATANGVPAGRLCAIQSGGVECYGEDGSFGKWVESLYEDSGGSLWVGTATGLWRWKPGPPKHFSPPEPQATSHGLSESQSRGLLWAVYQLRLRQVAQQFNMRLEERVSERTRIARDLHDTLPQSFHGLLLRFQAANNLLPERPEEARKTLESVIDQAAQAITQGRDAVQGLRSSTMVTNDLALAISALSEELGCGEMNPNCAELHVEVEGTPRNLHPILRDEVYRIAGEAVRNAFKHAEAQQIEVEIRYDERQLRLRIRDDGKGIDAKLLSDGGRPGHFGLRGMRERAKLLGGKLTVWSDLGSGTEVELGIPGSRAYQASHARPRSWLAERLSRHDTEMKS
jgi:signal transduction histidine kinase